VLEHVAGDEGVDGAGRYAFAVEIDVLEARDDDAIGRRRSPIPARAAAGRAGFRTASG